MLVSRMRELLRDIGCRFKDESRDKLRLLLLNSDVTETLSREAELGRDLLTGRPLVKKHSCSLTKHGKQLSLHSHLRNMFNSLVRLLTRARRVLSLARSSSN